MAYSPAAQDAGITGVRGLLTADPGTTGTSEASGTSYARGSSTFPATDGDGGGSTGTLATITAPTGASTVVTHVGIWTAETGGTFVCGIPLTTPETFSTAGGQLQYTPTLDA